MSETKNENNRFALETAATMCGYGKDDGMLPGALWDAINCACKRVAVCGGRIQSRQAVAALIAAYEFANGRAGQL